MACGVVFRLMSFEMAFVASGVTHNAWSTAKSAEQPIHGGACEEASRVTLNLAKVVETFSPSIAHQDSHDRSTLTHNLNEIKDLILQTECQVDDFRRDLSESVDRLEDAVREGQELPIARSAVDIQELFEERGRIPEQTPVACYDVGDSREVEKKLGVEVAARRDEDPLSIALESARACVLFDD